VLADTRHPPPASPILFRPIATTRQWLASEMEAVTLAMEAENLEMTVFLTRRSHLSPLVSQRFQRPLPDLGRSLSQESTSSLAQPRLYSPHMRRLRVVRPRIDPRWQPLQFSDDHVLAVSVRSAPGLRRPCGQTKHSFGPWYRLHSATRAAFRAARDALNPARPSRP
jgi:hypothetical protein